MRALAMGLVAGAGLALSSAPSALAQSVPSTAATPRAVCGPGSRPETGRQGRVSADDTASGRSATGFTCNTEMVSRFGNTGGYKVERYVDAAGHECAFYDTTLLFPGNVPTAGASLTGTYVLDMSDPTKPVKTANLLSPAFETPHESVSLNQKRGLIAAVTANPVWYPGVVDVYDVSKDCRNPTLQSSAPVGILGHEGNFSPDGKTYWAASLSGGTLTAIDVANPLTPIPLWVGNYNSHGLSLSDDGTRAYVAAKPGVIILDTTAVQNRLTNPQVKEVSRLTWDLVSTPQYTIPVTIQGHKYLIEVDEFANGDKVGAARIIDIADDTKPFVVSNLRLEVNQAENRADQMNDPGASSGLQGYAGHYCDVPQRVEPGIVACSFIISGLRVFDIRDPFNPREIAYFNAPVKPSATGGAGSNYAMSKPTFVPARSEIWYSDGNSGFYNVRVTNGVWPFKTSAAAGAGSTVAGAAAARAAGTGRPRTLAATGEPIPLGATAGAAGVVFAFIVWLRVRRRRAGYSISS